MSEYEYPDTDDRLTVRMIEEKEPYEGYWERSEEEVFSHAENFLTGEEISMLDIGCGDGRLFERFKTQVDEIKGLEPDPGRIEKAKDRDTDMDVDLVSEGFLEADLQSEFDLIVCSHVLQHVETRNLERFAEKLYSKLEEEGILVITTSHSTLRDDIFLKSYLEDDVLIEERISEREFNSLITNDENILPVHLFTLDSLRSLLDRFDFKSTKVFHNLHRQTFLDTLVFRDRWANLPLLKRKMGRDVLVVAEKAKKR